MEEDYKLKESTYEATGKAGRRCSEEDSSDRGHHIDTIQQLATNTEMVLREQYGMLPGLTTNTFLDNRHQVYIIKEN